MTSIGVPGIIVLAFVLLAFFGFAAVVFSLIKR